MSRLQTGFNESPRVTQPARRLACQQARASATPLYVAPAGFTATIGAIVICNTSASAVAIRLYHAISGESFGAANALLYDLSIVVGSTTTVELPIYLSPGDRIGFYAATAAAITFTVYGRESPAS